jgi:RNA polymerase sigma-70 factor (ECF subfamily)
MAIRSRNGLRRLVGDVRRAALPREPEALSDGRLLDAFLTRCDEAAFALLVKRHGPMVLGVCRRVIGHAHDAEDAFQAVFLVLARKAASIVPRDLVGNWLYGVAYRTALQARGRLVRHRARERQVTEMPQQAVAPDVDVAALHQALDGELGRLPEKYRVPVVLCDLEGRPRKDVARTLRVPEGTLSSRLAKGRALLARRLARHGLSLSGPALAVVLAQQTAAVEPALAGAAVTAAALTAAGQSVAGVVSAEILALSEGVLKTMFLNKLKVISVLVLGILLGGLGASLFGMPASLVAPPVQAAPPSAGLAGQPAQDRGDAPEPLDGNLLLDEQVQKELRLSKQQVARIRAVSQDVDVKTKPRQKTMQEMQQQIDELNKRIAELTQGIETNRTQIEKQRSQALGKTASDILSDKAVTRLRHIQRQQRGLDQLLTDASMQRLLKIDDEQLKQIETILKAQPVLPAHVWYDLGGRVYNQAHGFQLFYTPSGQLLWSGVSRHHLLRESAYLMLDRSDSWNTQGLQQLFNVLNPAQQRALSDWLGEPYPGTSWHALRARQK